MVVIGKRTYTKTEKTVRFKLKEGDGREVEDVFEQGQTYILPRFADAYWLLRVNPKPSSSRATGRDVEAGGKDDAPTALVVDLFCEGPESDFLHGRRRMAEASPSEWVCEGVSGTVSLIHNSVPVESYSFTSKAVEFTQETNCVTFDLFFDGMPCYGDDSTAATDENWEFEIKLRQTSEVSSWTGPYYQPSLVGMLDDPDDSFADVSVSGRDGGTPIRVHRSVLGFRVEYFRILLKRGLDNVPDGEHEGQDTTIFVPELTTAALEILVRRIYGESFPPTLVEEKSIPTLLEIWHFSTVTVMDEIPGDCERLLRGSVTRARFAACYRMALLLDRNNFQDDLRKIMFNEIKQLDKEALETFTCDDIVSLVSNSPPTALTLGWADLWLKYDTARTSNGSILFAAFPFENLPASENRAIAKLDIVQKHATKDSFLRLLAQQ